MTTMNAIRDQVKLHGNAYALPMLDAIEQRAKTDKTYDALLSGWLKYGSTVILRDDLCKPFGGYKELLRKAEHFRYPFDQIWMAIDSAKARVAPHYAGHCSPRLSPCGKHYIHSADCCYAINNGLPREGA